MRSAIVMSLVVLGLATAPSAALVGEGECNGQGPLGFELACLGVPYPGMVSIYGNGLSVPFAHAPTMTCAPLTWDGQTAQVTCVPAAAPPPLSYWVCQGPASFVNVFGQGGTVEGTNQCGGVPAQTCSATLTAPAPFGWCLQNPGVTVVGTFAITCTAVVKDAQGLGQWIVHCEFPDP